MSSTYKIFVYNNDGENTLEIVLDSSTPTNQSESQLVEEHIKNKIDVEKIEIEENKGRKIGEVKIQDREITEDRWFY